MEKLALIKSFLRYELNLKRNEYISKEKLQKIQLNKLSKLVNYAKSNSEFYKDLYKNIDPFNFKLTDLPIINKVTMMENLDNFLTVNLTKPELENYLGHPDNFYYKDKYVVMATGGTTGTKGIFVYSKDEWNVVDSLLLRFLYLANITIKNLKDKACVIAGDNLLHGSVRMTGNLKNSGIFNLEKIAANENINSIVEKLNKLQPELMLGYPSILNSLAYEQQKGNLKIKPKFIATSSEVLTSSVRKMLNETWNVKPFNLYVMTEQIPLGSECIKHNGIHINEDLCIIEVVDENNKPVPDGKRGAKILLTNLLNFTQPIIRYEIGDELGLSTELCSCGRTLRLIKKIDGRSDEQLIFKNREGEDVTFADLTFNTLFNSMTGIKEYRIVLNDSGLNFFLDMGDAIDKVKIEKKINEYIKNAFETVGVETPVISIHFSDQIPRLEGSEKITLIKDERSMPKKLSR